MYQNYNTYYYTMKITILWITILWKLFK